MDKSGISIEYCEAGKGQEGLLDQVYDILFAMPDQPTEPPGTIKRG